MRTNLEPKECAIPTSRSVRKQSAKYEGKGKSRKLRYRHNYKVDLTTPVIWKDVPFANCREAAKTLDIGLTRTETAWRKYGNIDQIPPGRRSVYYSKQDQHDDYNFVSKAVADYGVKPVARAYGVAPKNVRRKRDEGTLWTLSWWPSLEGYAGNMKITTHKELIDRIERPPRTPYVYLAIWKTGKRYIGSRTAEYCHPDDLMKKYFSSSPRVMEYIYKHGLPNHCYTHTCDTVMEALHTEAFLLKLVLASPECVRDNFLNKIYHFRYEPYATWPPYIKRNAVNFNRRCKKNGVVAE